MESNISELVGKTLISAVVNNWRDEIIFTSESGEKWKMYHPLECCEDVYIESIVGDLDDLIGIPILSAEEVSGDNNPPDVFEDICGKYQCFQWTFYKIQTIKGFVTIRWYGDSNGYYSVSVEFFKFY